MGAHATPLLRAPITFSAQTQRFWALILISLLLSSFTIALGDGGGGASPRDSDILLKLKASLLNVDALGSWNNSTIPCSGNYGNWIGVLCSNGNIWGLQLENMALTGDIDVDSLVLLPHLRTLSFMNDKFDGPLPNFSKLGSLKSLFLSNNQFSGPIPDNAFKGMGSLKKLYLSNNNFTGTIPTSLAHLPKLLELRLEANQFVGPLPNFQQKYLKLLNVSNNQLEGLIPPSLINLSPTSFSGNKDLCGKPVDTLCKSPEVPPNAPDTLNASNTPTSVPTQLEDTSNEKKSSLKIAIIVLSCGVALAAIVALLIIFCRSNNQTPQLGRAGSSGYDKHAVSVASAASLHAIKHTEQQQSAMMSRGSSVSKKAASAAEHGKLSFVRDDRLRFDLQDLLRASAEVLGSGNFGSSYKAVLMDGQAVVVKRFKQMNNVGREEFHEHMRRLGRLKHPNLLSLVAYYYRKEEKLLVFDYVHNGSLASHLHANHTTEQPGLDWPTRLKIVKGVARGVAYLYNELPSLIVPHGHLKSSNVLLDESFEPLLMDYTLVPVVNPEHAQQILVAYKSPEYAQHARTTKKTDVWSLGILILEILTGKFPANYLAQGMGNGTVNLASWVDSIVKEESPAQVIDKEMGGCTHNGTDQGEMLKLFKIGVACCEEDVETRWDLKEVVDKIEELKATAGTGVVVDHV
ncbi:pollen receptor-like kinase 4 [Actinidia eriantha]|uniref:pollen receptor-like kinase 4 n=1 Tax=Actinidia eriantha TaxID=165200 RepID=UPI00258B2F87|nr:pollen receptor-like kinase 4 [Actinidia eriantha]